VPPGRYEVRLIAGGRTVAQPFEVVKDPRVTASDQDLREQYALAKRSHDLLTKMHDAILTLRDARAQAEAWVRRSQSARVKDTAGALVRTLTAIENELVQVRSEDPRMFPAKLNSRLATVVVLVEYSDAAPTRALRELSESLASRIEAELTKLDRCLTDDVSRFNALCFDEGASAIVPTPRRP
jgi:hypothetical protein